MIGGPKPPQSPLGRMQAPTLNAEGTKIFGWKRHGILVVAVDDTRLSWVEKELIQNLGDKLYGQDKRQEVSHG